MVYLPPVQNLMEDNNYEYSKKKTECSSDNSKYFPEIIDDTYELSHDKTKVELKLDPELINDVDSMFNFMDPGENVVYIVNDFSNDFHCPSISQNSPLVVPYSSESLTMCDQTSLNNSSTFNSFPSFESSFSVSRAASVNNNNHPGELKKLLKVDVLSPDSFGSSYQSINENLSIDSSQSNQTMNQCNQSDLCVICNDFATGKHYGVSACEGCKGFFKRTIRKNLAYNCRDRNLCPITERLRNRCQSCRFKKCLEKGMKIEAVQKERTMKNKVRPAETCGDPNVPPIKPEDILENEMSFYCTDTSGSESSNPVEVGETKQFCSIVNKQLFNLVRWAKSVPGFAGLERSDQIILLNASWVELLIASFSYQSSIEPEFGYIKMDDTHRLSLTMAAELGMQHLMIRFVRELIIALKRLQVDQMEMACLKMIILFNSNFNNLKNAELIRKIRFSIIDILRNYVTRKYPRQPYRIYKLLLKLPLFRGFTSSFMEKMKAILFDESPAAGGDQPSMGDDQSDNVFKPDLLYPLFSEMMKQKDYPYL